MVVAQNIVGSLFNSHLFDFTHGWMYVLGVGVCGGMVAAARARMRVAAAMTDADSSCRRVREFWSSRCAVSATCC